MKGYEPISVYTLALADREVLASLGIDLNRDKGRMCGLCPRDAACRNDTDCDLTESMVWVPEHVAAIVKMHTSNR